jgi:hypothetical protein
MSLAAIKAERNRSNDHRRVLKDMFEKAKLPAEDRGLQRRARLVAAGHARLQPAGS